MRKNAKERKVITNDEMSVGGFVKIIVWLLIILIGFTLITMYVTRDKKEKPSNDIQYTNIIVGSILNRSEEDYFVLVEKEDDTNIQSYQTMIDKYNNKDEHSRFYIVLLSDRFRVRGRGRLAQDPPRPREILLDVGRRIVQRPQRARAGEKGTGSGGTNAWNSDLSVEKITDIRFSETTLLHIKNGKIASTRVGNDISDYLNKLSA